MPLTEEMLHATGYSRGGYLAQIPEPHQRRWPDDPAPRTVSVSVGRYSMGEHYHTQVQEEDNPLWDSSPITYYVPADHPKNGQPHNCWRCAWDDAAGRGRTWERTFRTEAAAYAWVESILAEHFTGPRFLIYWPDRTYVPFHYTRDGD